MKKWISVGLILTMAISLIGCSGKNKDEVNPDDYVTLGEYKNITVDVNYYDFTEDELKQYVEQDLEYYVSTFDLYDYKPIKDKKIVSENDIVNIDYIGTLDGVAFDGGTDEGAHLEIGSGSFIPGFEDGLIGVAVGDTVDLNLTFPEGYGNEDLAGKDVVFSVMVNSIDEANDPKYDESFFDEYCAAYGIENVKNYDELIDYARQSINDAKDSYNEAVLAEAIWTKVSSSCTVGELPQKLIDEKKSQIDEELQSYADGYGLDTDTALGYLGYDKESYEQFKQETASTEVQKDLICMAIAKAEGITITEDDIKAMSEEEYASAGFESAEALMESKSEAYLRDYTRYKKVMEILKGYATANELETISLLGDYLY